MFKYSPITFFLQIKITLVKWNHYLMIQVFLYMKICLGNGRESKIGNSNDKMENITSEWFFLRWFQHNISMALRNQETICFILKPIKVLVQ